jgi:hypothetical protein
MQHTQFAEATDAGSLRLPRTARLLLGRSSRSHVGYEIILDHSRRALHTLARYNLLLQ